MATVLFTVFFAAAVAASPAHDDYKGKASPVQSYFQAPLFELTAQDGQRVKLSSFRGKIVLLNFIYTTCIDYCPFVTADALSVYRRDRKSGMDDLRLLFITTDPEVDKPEVLIRYASRYRVNLKVSTFLTGSEVEMRPVWKSYGVKVNKKERGLVNHTMLTVLIDAEGKIRRRYLGGRVELAEVLKDIGMVRADT